MSDVPIKIADEQYDMSDVQIVNLLYKPFGRSSCMPEMQIRHSNWQMWSLKILLRPQIKMMVQ